MIILPAILLSLFGWSANCKTLVFAAPGADTKDYEAFVLSTPAYDFPSHYFLADLPDPANRAQLAEHFARAKLDFIQGSLVEAISEFKAVVALASIDQWNDDDKSVFLYSYLRLAQLEGGNAAASWMKQATIWSRQGIPDPSAFPPPLLEQFYAAQKSAAVTSVSLEKFQSDFRFLLVNGERIDLRSSNQAFLPDGPLHITLLSDVYEPVTADVSVSAMASYNPKKRAWVKGSCAHPSLQWTGQEPAGKAFFSMACISPHATLAEIQSRLPTSDPALKPDSEPPPPQAATSPPIYRRTWFWIAIGAAVVATTLEISANQHRSSSSPTIAEGF